MTAQRSLADLRTVTAQLAPQRALFFALGAAVTSWLAGHPISDALVDWVSQHHAAKQPPAAAYRELLVRLRTQLLTEPDDAGDARGALELLAELAQRGADAAAVPAPLRAFLIDPEARQIREVTHDGTLAATLALLEVRTIDARRIDRNAVVYVDDEGLATLDHAPIAGFSIAVPGEASAPVLAGRGLVMGTQGEGDDADAPFTLAELTQRVVFGWITEEDDA